MTRSPNEIDAFERRAEHDVVAELGQDVVGLLRAVLDVVSVSSPSGTRYGMPWFSAITNAFIAMPTVMTPMPVRSRFESPKPMSRTYEARRIARPTSSYRARGRSRPRAGSADADRRTAATAGAAGSWRAGGTDRR